MATYDRLSVSAGGGIMNDMKKSDRQDDATLCIGLGGTGKDALKKLKKEVYRRLKPDDPESPIPFYGSIRFLLIDSDDADLGITQDISSIDKATEYFDISNNEIVKTFRSKEIIAVRKELSWLNHEHIGIQNAGHGAGGIRQVGRFLLIDKAALFKAKLTALIQDAIQGVTGDLNIHLFSGLSGGTGSGTFLDVCYIVRHVLETLGRDSAQISGYFFLPDVNLSVPSIIGSPLTANYVRCNGYAALKELDYMMGLEEAQGKFVQNYGSFEVSTSRTPVDLCYLISATTAGGVVMKDGYEYGLSVAVDYVISFLSKVTLPDGLDPAQAGSMTLKGHISNLAQAKNNIKKIHGASFEYNIIGAANAEMPLSDIATYLGAKLFERFGDISDHVPTEKDLMAFVSANQLTFEQLMQQLTKGVVYKVPYPHNLVKGSDITPGDRRVISCADTWTANALGSLEENRKKMLEPLEDYNIPDQSTSLISRIFSNLYLNFAMDFATGPFFAMRLLGGQNNKNLIHVIDGYIQNNEERLAAELRQEPIRRQALDTAEQALAKSNFINRKKHTEEYLEAVNHWYVHLAVIDRHNCMKNFLREFRDQVVKLNNGFFLVMSIVLDTLKNTFSENSRHLMSGKTSKSVYTWQILTIRDIKDQLDETVMQLDPDQEMKKLVLKLFKQWPDWISQDENKITRLVSEYITQEFLTITNKEMTDYLKIKFETTDSTRLMERIKTEIIQKKLSRNADPLFWKNGLFDLSDIAKSNTISIPFNAAEIIQAAEAVRQEGDTVRRTGLTDRIFMMRFYSGIPLYAYQGLAELEKAYEANTAEAGRHLYEAGDMDWREYLPSPYPDSFKMDGHLIPRITKRNQRLAEELDAARKAGIVCSDAAGWYVKCTKLAIPSSDLENEEPDPIRLEEMLDILKAARKQMYQDNNIDRITLSTKGAREGSEETVLRDNYFRYPEVEKKVREQLAKINALDQEIARLEKISASIVSEKDKQELFFHAVFTGIIRLERSKTTFTYEQFGIEEILDLQNSAMPYGSKAPLYQAFLTYKGLEEDLAERIHKQTVNALDNMTDEIYLISGTIQARYTSDFLKMILSRIAADPKRKEIQTFYNEFIQALQNYRITYQ